MRDDQNKEMKRNHQIQAEIEAKKIEEFVRNQKKQQKIARHNYQQQLDMQREIDRNLQLKGQMDQRELAMNKKEIEAYQKQKRTLNSIIPGINSKPHFDGTTALNKKRIETINYSP